MTLYLGIDVGTSGVKAALIDPDDRLAAEASQAIAVSAPFAGWSEQDPDLWWQALEHCLDALAAREPDAMDRVAGIGLSGQMLGAVLVDAAGRPLRPAILWNDQRAQAECAELLARVPDIGRRTNGTPDPGLTAPKLLWLARHEPRVLEAARWLMLPKDYVRLRLTGEVATEPSDAGGTMLMDCATAAWDPALCAAAGWPSDRLPPVVPSWSAAGVLRPALARRWGLAPGLPVAAGAGDNMACSLGVGAARPGDAVATIGTSAVLCAVDGAFHPIPAKAVLTGPHAAPATWLSMGVVMSATQSLDWLARLAQVEVAALMPEIDAFASSPDVAAAPLMRPSLTGVRTPHNRPDAAGSITGIIPGTGRAALGYALLEGVAFQLLDCLEAQTDAGVPVEALTLVGGGARSRLWARMIASLFDRPIVIPEAANLAAPIGAARLAAVAAAGGEPLPILARQPRVEAAILPDAMLRACLIARREAWARLPLEPSPPSGAGGAEARRGPPAPRVDR
jgi:xylulokinase